jgi:GNAT superfamily N-acetyltransferase
VFIRSAATSSDWKRAREICVATGAAGRPITATRAPFFGDFWVGPYERLLPGWTYVAEHEGRVVGYLTGCPDTASFERRKRLLFTPLFFAKVMLGGYGGGLGRGYRATGDAGRFVRRTLGFEPEPNALFSRELRERLFRDYPAHLHVNLETEAVRGKGAGRALMKRFFEDLERAGVRGVHVHCGAGPVPFYLKMGFTELERVEFKPGAPISVMGRRS